MRDHVQALRRRISSMKEGPPPTPWKVVSGIGVGGLREVGFSADSRFLLIISHDGRGLLEVPSGNRVARDRCPPDDSWHDPIRLTARGLGPLADVTVPIAGLCGGGLPLSTADGWTLGIAYPEWPEVCLVLQPPGASVFQPDRSEGCVSLAAGAGEFRAAGFSPDGTLLVIATSADLTLIGRQA